jgi:hypothetical protein
MPNSAITYLRYFGDMTDLKTADPQLATRVAQLEQRVAELEASGSQTGRSQPGEIVTSDFWALEELKVRQSSSNAVLFTGAVTLPDKTRHEWQQQFDVDALLERDWSLLSDVLGALGHPVRLTLLREVMSGVETVAELGNLDGLGTTGQIYHHLRQLVAAGWLRTAGRGRYRVPGQRVVPLLVVLAAAQR